jgi:hypothetical protein
MAKRGWLKLLLLSCFCWVGAQAPALAFDTGHHSDLTQEVLADQGFNRNAQDVATVENWLVDYYSNQPITGLRQQLAFLHFDNLSSDQQVRNYWGHLTANTKLAIQNAARANDPIKILAITGMSLHAVQDFYTHSNWVNLFATQPNTYNTNTWFSTLGARGVFTGRYEQPGPQPEHGDYNSGLNKDSYNRPNWDRAYVNAYAASQEWVAQLRQWVNEANPSVWNRAQALALSPKDRQQLDFDLEAAYRISEWVAVNGADGHWKGKGSGSTADLAAFTARWTASPDSIFVDHFKVKRWFTELLPGLANPVAPPPVIPAVNRRPLAKIAVIVRTLLVAEEPVGLLETKIDPAGKPDFYAKITIAGQTLTEATQMDQSQVNPDWTAIRFIDSNQATVPIRYELWDEDGGVRGDDDRCDINPRLGSSLDFILDLRSQLLSGDITGVHNNSATAITSAGNEKDRARVKFFVTWRPLSTVAAPGLAAPGLTLPGTGGSNPLEDILRMIKPLLE